MTCASIAQPKSAAAPRRLMGALYLSAAVLCFALLDTLTKYLSAHYSVTSLIWVRYTVQTLLLAAIMGPSMGLRLVLTRQPGSQLLRALFLLGASACTTVGVRYLPLAEMTAMFFLAPLIVCVLSVPMLREKIGAGDWLAVIIGFVGVLVIARPGGAMLTLATLLPLGTAICYSIYQVITRQVSASEHPTTSNFITSLVGAVLMTFTLPFGWTTPTWSDAPLMLGMGVAGLSGHLLLTRAYQVGSPAVLAPYSYGQILWATLFGFLVFGALPDATSVVGMAVIVASGLYISYHRMSARKGAQILKESHHA